MVAYPERWMDRVEAMKTLQGWDDTPVLLFRDLAVFGEQILLSSAYGARAGQRPARAGNWARYWRSAIQAYSHAAGAVTGMDLTSSANGGVPPCLQRRLAVPHNGR